MDRFEFEDLISAYIENDLSLNKRKDFEAYLDKNPSQNQLVRQTANNIKAFVFQHKKLNNLITLNFFSNT